MNWKHIYEHWIFGYVNLIMKKYQKDNIYTICNKQKWIALKQLNKTKTNIATTKKKRNRYGYTKWRHTKNEVENNIMPELSSINYWKIFCVLVTVCRFQKYLLCISPVNWPVNVENAAFLQYDYQNYLRPSVDCHRLIDPVCGCRKYSP